MKTLKVVFRDGVFVPVEPCFLPNGTEGVVVYVESEKELPAPWWNSLSLCGEKKEALKQFVENLKSRVDYDDVRVVEKPEGFEVFVLVEDETVALKPVMEEALKIYEEKGVYLPLQVISRRRLNRWREVGSSIYREIDEGVSIG